MSQEETYRWKGLFLEGFARPRWLESSTISCLKTRHLCLTLAAFLFLYYSYYKYYPYEASMGIVLWANAHCLRRAAWLVLQEPNQLRWSDGWIWSQASGQQWQDKAWEGNRKWGDHRWKALRWWQLTESGARSLLLAAVCHECGVLLRGMLIYRKWKGIREIYLGIFFLLLENIQVTYTLWRERYEIGGLWDHLHTFNGTGDSSWEQSRNMTKVSESVWPKLPLLSWF